MSNKAKTTATKEEETSPLVPRIRFPEFRAKESWSLEPMARIYSFKSNNSLSRDKLNYGVGSVKNIHYGDIHSEFSTHFDITKERAPFINESELGLIQAENLCTEGDIILADASEDLEDIGKSIEIVNLRGELLVSGLHTILAHPVEDGIASGFGGYLFKSQFVRAQIQKEAQGSKVLGISPSRLRNILLPLPSSKWEQQKIADCLSSVDEVIATQARKLDALKIHQKGLMQQLFPREGETQPRLRFPEFRNAGPWVKKVLHAIAEPVSERAGNEDENNILTLSAEQGLVLQSEYFGKKVAGANAERYLKIQRDDFVYNDRTTKASVYGTIKRLKKHPHGIVSPIYKCFRFKGDEPPGFWEWYFESGAHEPQLASLANEGARAGRFNVSIDRFLSTNVWAPDSTSREQQRIAACLSTLDDLIAAEAQELENLKIHSRGLLQQLFPTPAEGKA